MTKKIRLTRTMIVEYEPNPDYYPEGLTIEEMAQTDCATDDLELLFDDCLIDDRIEWCIVDC